MRKKNEKQMKKKNGDVSTGVKILFTLAVLAALFVIGTFIYSRIYYSATTVVDEYVRSFTAKSPGKIFRTLNLKNTRFITSDNLDKLLKDIADYDNITSYSLVKLDESDDVCHYQVKYMVGRMESDFSQVLTLKKSDDTYMLFFRKWCIDSADLIASKVAISVPLGAELTVDGVKLPADSLRKKSEKMQDFELGDIFIGEHEFEVSLDGFNPYQGKFTLEAKNYQDEPVVSVGTNKLSPDAGITEVLQNLIARIIPKIYEDLLQRRSFDFLAKEVAIEPSMQDGLMKRYDKMREKHVDTRTHLTYVDFDKFKSKVRSTISMDDCYALKVDTTAGYIAHSTVVYGETPEIRAKRGKLKVSSVFHYSNGQWWLYDSDAFGRFVDYIKN